MPNYKRLFVENCYLFLTLVTYQRQPILLNNTDLLKKAFKYSFKKFNYNIFAIAIMPDHLHLILKLENIKDYPKIIYLIKYYFSIHLPKQQVSTSKENKGEKGIWQRRYWEHTIIDEKDLYKHLDYVHYNPLKHGLVSAPKEYEFSSFKKFVKNNYYDIDWCNYEDKNEINNLNLE